MIVFVNSTVQCKIMSKIRERGRYYGHRRKVNVFCGLCAFRQVEVFWCRAAPEFGFFHVCVFCMFCI